MWGAAVRLTEQPSRRRAVFNDAASSAVLFLPSSAVVAICHESGHYAVARWLGHEPQIYDSFTVTCINCSVLPGDSAIVAGGGIVTDIVLGSLGVVWLSRLCSAQGAGLRIGIASWVALLLAVSWLRPFLLGTKVALTSIGSTAYDEGALSNHLGWPPWSIIAVTFTASCIVLGWVMWRCVTLAVLKRYSVGVLLGLVAGWLLWFKWLGRVVFPIP